MRSLTHLLSICSLFTCWSALIYISTFFFHYLLTLTNKYNKYKYHVAHNNQSTHRIYLHRQIIACQVTVYIKIWVFIIFTFFGFKNMKTSCFWSVFLLKIERFIIYNYTNICILYRNNPVENSNLCYLECQLEYEILIIHLIISVIQLLLKNHAYHYWHWHLII